MVEFAGKAQPLTRGAVTKALARIGLGADDAAYVWTVLKVETHGFGFDASRRPRILFERHKFRGFTNGQFDAVAPDISGPPGGYGTFDSQYGRLQKALELCKNAGLGPEPALKSASWGIGQVMGYNHDSAGFASASDMVQAMMVSEEAQLLGMVGFLEANHLVAPLVARQWDKFARGYNGSQYWKNQYDVKLAEAYQRYTSGSLPNLEVRSAQAALTYLGFSPGSVDGVMGQRTRTAIRNFRVANGLSDGDELEGPTYATICARAGIDTGDGSVATVAAGASSSTGFAPNDVLCVACDPTTAAGNFSASARLHQIAPAGGELPWLQDGLNGGQPTTFKLGQTPGTAYKLEVIITPATHGHVAKDVRIQYWPQRLSSGQGQTHTLHIPDNPPPFLTQVFVLAIT